MRSRRTSTALVAAVGLSAAACAGGVSDSTSPQAGDGSRKVTVNLYAYSASKAAFAKLIPAFQATAAAEGVAIRDSYGPSGDQSRAVAAGAPADVVSLSLDSDVTRLVDTGLVAPDWNANPVGGEAFGSLVTIVVRKGNPKQINDWSDLVKPGVEVVTPNPMSSGAARWNLLAPFAALSKGGRDPAVGLKFISLLVKDHLRTQPKSARDASEAFLQGAGDALITYENEALLLEDAAEPVQHVTPPETLRIENPIAALKTSRNRVAASNFVRFVQSPLGQELVAQAGFRPTDRRVLARYANKFPQPRTKLWRIADLGGWKQVDATYFDADRGSIARIYANGGN